jgi:hypothetical protein
MYILAIDGNVSLQKYESRVPNKAWCKPSIPKAADGLRSGHDASPQHSLALLDHDPLDRKWYAALPPSHLPHESLGLESRTQDPLQLGQPPLHFLSHQAAMNYVYYVTAWTFQSREGMDEFLAPPSLSPRHSAQSCQLGVDH